jgi:UDP-N-acetylglucosamine acyltransferase
MIHSTAIVDESVRGQLDASIDIGAFAVVEAGVTLGANCRVAAHAVIKRGTRLGEGVSVDHHAVIGGLPQDLAFDPAVPSGVWIGAGTRIREGVTVHRATRAGAETRVGAGCFLMALAHVAHDCDLGAGAILANASTLGGHVSVGERAFISGGVVVHQFVRVGESVMCSGNGRFSMDIPPFTLVAERNHISGLNLVGLRRRGFSREIIGDIKSCYHAVYPDAAGNPAALAAAALAAGLAKTEEGRRFLEFFTAGGVRGQFVRRRVSAASSEL